MMLRHSLGIVEASTFVDVQDNGEPELFPDIEWSRFDHDRFGPATTIDEIADIAERGERLRSLLERRSKRRSIALGLLRSKSLLCLPSAAKELEKQLARPEERSIRRGCSGTLLSAAISKYHKNPASGSATHPSSPFDYTKRRSPKLMPTPWLSRQQQANSKKTAMKPSLVSLEGTNPLRREQVLLESLLRGCPFPTCP